jgi:hypothetical protein
MTDKIPNTKETFTTGSQSPTKITQNGYPNMTSSKQQNGTSIQTSKAYDKNSKSTH